MSTTHIGHHGMHWAPRSRDGRWATILATLALGGTVALAVSLATWLERPETFSDNWWVFAAGTAILASAAASVVTGAVALLRRADHSWSVLAGTLVGLLVTLTTLQQVAEGLGWLSS